MATTTPPSGDIVFYDIAHKPPVEKTSFAPNPWKSRFALNFKAMPYSTRWVGMPDVSKVRQELGVPANRQFADGADFNTLPIIHNTATDAKVGDSFDIAVYLQREYPNSGAGDLFPAQNLNYTFEQNSIIAVPLSVRDEVDFPDYARFNTHVDAAFTTHVQLALQNMPLDPACEEYTKAEFIRRAGVTCWEDMALTGEVREQVIGSLRDTLGSLSKLFLRDTSGPFLLGENANYADLIVGAWLRMLSRTLPESEWEQVKGWHEGAFGKLHDALEVYAEVK